MFAYTFDLKYNSVSIKFERVSDAPSFCSTNVFRSATMKVFFNFLFLACIVLSCASARAESMYLTFLAPEAAGSIQKSEVSFKINKKDTPITEFFSVDVAQHASEILNHPAGRRHYIFVYDLIFSKPQDLVQARKTTAEFLEKLETDDLFAIAAVSNKASLRFFSGFTTDRNSLIAGLNAIGKETVEGMIQGPDGNYYPAGFSKALPPIELLQEEQFLGNLKTILPDPAIKADLRSNFVEGIINLASFLSKIEGRKNVILFSPGFSLEGIKQGRSSAGEEPELVMDGEEGVEGGVDLGAEKKGTSFEYDIEAIPDYVAGSDSHVHIFSPGPEDNEFYKDLSKKTNGVYLKSGSDLGAGIAQILASDKFFYVIGWNGATEKNFQELSSIKIDVSGKKVLAPPKWLAPTPFRQYSPAERQMHIAKAIHANYQQPSSSTYFWSDYLFEDGISKVPVFIQIPASDLLKGTALDFYGFTMNSEGRILDFYSSPVLLDQRNENLMNQLAKAGVKIWNVLLADKGPTQVRWIIVNSMTGETITHSEKLNIKDSELTITTPFFPALKFDWIVWPKATVTENRRGVEIKYPYRIGEEYFFPDLSPEIERKEKGRIFYFKIYNIPPNTKNPPIMLQLTDRSGKSVKIEEFGLKQKPESLAAGGLELFWKIVSFPDVPAGPYRFQVHIGDTARNLEFVREIKMEIR